MPRAVRSTTSADGVIIRYEVAGAGAPALVFVHGWCCDRTYWSAQIEHFAGSHRVVAIDLAGHGQSGDERDKWTMQSFGADVAAVLQSEDLRGAALVGHSMGAAVAVEAARLAPDRVSAVISVDHFLDVGRRDGAEALEARIAHLKADFRANVEAMVRSFFAAGADPELVARIATGMASAAPTIALDAFSHLRQYDQTAALAALAHPMRMINADHWPTNLEAARAAKADISLAVMPGVGHFVAQEDPPEFNRLLSRAINELVPGRGGQASGRP